MLEEPVASSGRIEHADWLELSALQADDRNSSFQDLVAVLRRAGSVDAIATREGSYDKGSEVTQELADAAFSEIEARARACNGAYPFDVAQQYIQLRDKGAESSTYIFMLLLKRFGVNAGPRAVKGAGNFEELSAEAARRYLGGDTAGAECYHFGFPRRTTPSGFKEALNELCQRLQEGGGAKNRPRQRHQKDAKLDLVAWRHFPDRRNGKIVAFGQCAAGDQFDIKVTELQPRRFLYMWMVEHIIPDPLSFFFMPSCSDDDDWLNLVSAQVIVFDRCRIAALLEGGTDPDPLPEELEKRTGRWSNYVLRRVRSA